MIIEDLRSAINNGKTSGTQTSFELKYVVDYTNGDSAFAVDIYNGLVSWVNLINEIYSPYVNMNLVSSSDAPHISILFADIADNSILQGNIIKLKSSIDSTYVLNHVVYNTGLALGLGTEIVSLNPMNKSQLIEDYTVLYTLGITSEGYITENFLNTFDRIRVNIATIYGNPDSTALLIYGCTDDRASNFDLNATVNDGSCLDLPDETPSIIQGYSPFSYLEPGNFSYLLTETTYATKLTDGLLTNKVIISDNVYNVSINGGNGDPSTNIGTTLVITDKSNSAYSNYSGPTVGSIKYYVVIEAKGNAIIFNSDGKRLSDTTNVEPEVNGTNTSKYISNLNITYSYSGEKHTISYTDIEGNIRRIILNDTLPQTGATGETIVNCNVDTLQYGNLESYAKYDGLFAPLYFNENSDTKTINVSGGKIQLPATVDEQGNSDTTYLAYVYPTTIQGYPAPGKSGTPGATIRAFGSTAFTVSNEVKNGRNFIIPTLIGNVYANIDLYSNVLKICSAKTFPITSHNSIYLGDASNHDLTSESIPESYQGLDTLRNTKLDLGPFDLSASYGYKGVVLRPFSGFSFDSYDLSIFSIHGKTWSASTYKFDIGETLSHSNHDAGNFEYYVDEYQNLPVVIGNKLVSSIHTTDPNKVSYKVSSNIEQKFGHILVYDSEFPPVSKEIISSYNYVGAFHLAMGVKHGFILVKVSNTNFSLLSPQTEDGIELHVPGGNTDMVNANGGWTPVSMQFSPDDNFLYTIVENPDNSSERKIAIYPVNSGGTSGCVAANGKELLDRVIVVDNQLSGTLHKVTLQSDGAIYIWDTGSEYYKIPQSDLLLSVELFESNPVPHSLYSKYFTPTSLYSNKVLNTEYLGRQALIANFGENDDITKDPRAAYQNYYNANRVPTPVGEGIPDLVAPEYNSQTIYPGFTFNSVTNEYEVNTESTDGIWAASATQTSDGADTDIILYAVFDSAANEIIVRESDGTELTRIATGFNAREYDSQNSLFILPNFNSPGDYILGYLNKGTAEDDLEYRYRQIKIESTGNDVNPYSYTLGDDYVFIPETATAVLNNTCLGHGIIKETSSKKIVSVSLLAIKNITAGQEQVTIKAYVGDVTNSMSSDISRDEGNSKDVIIYEDADINAATIFDGVVSFSKDTSRVAIAVSDPERQKMSIAVYEFDIDALQIGNQIGETIQYSITNPENAFFNIAKFANPKIRSMEFSPDNSILYVLIGNRYEVWTNNEESTPDILDMSYYNQSELVAIEVGETSLTDAGLLNSTNQYEITSSASRSSRSLNNGHTFTATGELSDAGNTNYEEASNMLYLSPLSDGNIAISNSHLKEIDVDGSPVYFRHMQGIITAPNSIEEASFSKTATVSRVNSIEEASYGVIGSRSNPSQNKTYVDVADDLDTPKESSRRYTSGCTDPDAENYQPNANKNDGSCVVYTGDAGGGCSLVAHELNLRFRDSNDIVNWEVDNGLESFYRNALRQEAAVAHFFDEDRTCPTHIYDVLRASEYVVPNELCDNQCMHIIGLTFVIRVRHHSGCRQHTDYRHTAYFLWMAPPAPNSHIDLPGAPTNGGTAEHPQKIYANINFFYLPSGGLGEFAYHCLHCTDDRSPTYSGVPPSSCISPYCVSYPEACGVGGCTDSNACNYNPAATYDDGSCLIPKAGCQCDGNGGFEFTDPDLSCGDCYDDYAITYKDGEFCNCDNNPLPYPLGHAPTGEFHCDCEGNLPSQEATDAGCACDGTGTLKLKDAYSSHINGYCDCVGGRPESHRCDCDGKVINSTLYCDCDTDVATYYPDPDGNGYASCDLPAVKVCPKLGGTSDYTDVLTGNTITASDLANNYIVGPFNAVDCEECAEESAVIAAASAQSNLVIPGSIQEYNCNGECRFKVANTNGSVMGNTVLKGDIYPSPYWVATIANNCGECVSPGTDLSDCCNKDENGDPILDACDSCINKIDETQIQVNQVGDKYTIEGTSYQLDCSPCSELSPNQIFENASSAAEKAEDLANRYTTNGCNVCGEAPFALVESGRFTGYLKAGDTIKCSCDATATAAPQTGDLSCCDGYQYDDCLQECISVDTPLSVKDCGGACPDAAVTYAYNGCGVCTAGGQETYNAVGCCNDDVLSECSLEDVDAGTVTLDTCYQPGTQPKEDVCGVCNGDGSTCSGCTDPEANNYNENAVGDPVGCLYEDLYDITTGIVVDMDGDTAQTESIYFIGDNKDTDLFGISQNSYYDYNAIDDVYIDQQKYTHKCQVIKNGNFKLIVENPTKNAEITYTNYNAALTELNKGKYVDLDTVDRNYRAAYYFRLVEGIKLTTFDPAIIFAQHLDKIDIIKDAYGSNYMPQYDFNGIGDLKSGKQDSFVNDTSNTISRIKPFYAYRIVPKINPDTGHPYEFTVDFEDFLREEVLGCTNPNASNFNPNANVDDGSCEFVPVNSGHNLTFINKGVTDSSKLRWVIYNYKNEVVHEGDSTFFLGFEANINKSYTQNLDGIGMGGCTYFVPIGFKYEDQWQHVKFMVTKENVVKKVVSYGSEVDPWTGDNRGSFMLQRGIEGCAQGCDNALNPTSVKTDYCTSLVRKDSSEFTNIIFTGEIGGSQSNPGEIIAEIVDLDTGVSLVNVEMTEIDEVYTANIAVDKTSRLGIFIDSSAVSQDASVRYRLESEFGELITKKVYDNRSAISKTFDPVTIELVEAGCTDPDSANYNPQAKINDGMCFNKAFENCVADMLFSVSLRDCSSAEAKRALKVYAIYEGYKQAVREANQTKINIYSQQLADMCNAEYCESC